MARARKTFQTIFSLFLLGFSACGPNPGVEVGNPKLAGTVLTLQPLGFAETFVIEFLTETSSQVSKILDNQFETVPAATNISPRQVEVVADFAGGPHFDADLEVDDEGNILSVALALNGASTPVDAKIEDGKTSTHPSSDPALTNEALQLVSALCSRIADCQSSVDAAQCEATVAEMEGLAREFGGPPDQSLQGQAGQVEHGNSVADEAALDQCLNEIAIVPCSQVDKAHDAADPEGYPQIRRMIPKPSCSHAFSRN